ncbi:hypothetical protein PG985_012737 [Apiospora marii]|uniref:Uncharacterized protein n=1 Tax=Apiospora marii TaxID=335849 RepID=A0ABR1RDJ9_9PEZI
MQVGASPDKDLERFHHRDRQILCNFGVDDREATGGVRKVGRLRAHIQHARAEIGVVHAEKQHPVQGFRWAKLSYVVLKQVEDPDSRLPVGGESRRRPRTLEDHQNEFPGLTRAIREVQISILHQQSEDVYAPLGGHLVASSDCAGSHEWGASQGIDVGSSIDEQAAYLAITRMSGKLLAISESSF